MKTRIATFVLGAAIAGCSAPPPETTPDAGVIERVDAYVAPDVPEICGPSERPVELERFGATHTEGVPFVCFEDLVANPEAYASMTLETEAVVRANCQVRGCWMELRSPEAPDSDALVVRFLDYGFFVPLDSRGADAAVQGVFTVTTYSPEEVHHAQSEDATFDMILPDGSARVLSFTASGVEMWNRAH